MDTYDALVDREIRRLSVFTDWCQKYNLSGFIGEMGWNQNEVSVTSWNSLVQTLITNLIDPTNCHATFFAASGSATPGGILTIYDGSSASINSARAGSAVVEASALSRPLLGRGVNVVGGEFAAPVATATSTFSNLNLGTYGLNYSYQDAASATYLKGRGLTLARVSLRWERIQPTLGGALDATEIARLMVFLDRAASIGLKCVVDVHNYGGYYKDVSGTGTRFTINDGTLTIAHFIDLWTRLSTLFKSHTGVWAYGLMNEPISMTVGVSPIAVSPVKNWEYITKQVVTAIRARGDSKMIMIPGYNLSHAHTWTTFHSEPWVFDTNVSYEAHHYFDTAVSGAGVYLDEGVLSRLQGYGSSVPTVVKAGTPSDADWAIAPPIGTIVVDTAASKLWVRTAVATWKFLLLV